MKAWANKILFVLISLSFAIAVFELDVGARYHSFNDDDDIYIQSNNRNVEFNTQLEKQHYLLQGLTALASEFVIIDFSSFNTDFFLSPDRGFRPFTKIFLRNSVLLI